MKLSALRPCDACRGPFKGGLFYVVRASLAIIAPRPANEILGLTQIFGGNLRLAEAMSPDDNAIKLAGEHDPALWTELFICSACYLQPLMIPMLAENRAAESTGEPPR